MDFQALSDLVDTFENAFDVPVARENAASFDGGVQTVSTWSQLTIERCVIVPNEGSGISYMLGPEGYRLDGDYLLFARSRYAPGGLLYEERDPDRRPDIIEWQGSLWRPSKVADWRPSADVIQVGLLRLDRPETTVAAYVAAMTREVSL